MKGEPGAISLNWISTVSVRAPGLDLPLCDRMWAPARSSLADPDFVDLSH